jgi:hypothetical protein
MVTRVVYHVLPGADGWSVKKGRAARASSTHPTKTKALRAAAKLARNHPLAQVVEHDAAGVIVADRRYERSDYRKTRKKKRAAAKARKTRLRKHRRVRQAVAKARQTRRKERLRALRQRQARRQAARLGLARRRRRAAARRAAAKKAAARRRR